MNIELEITNEKCPYNVSKIKIDSNGKYYALNNEIDGLFWNQISKESYHEIAMFINMPKCIENAVNKYIENKYK